MKILTINCGDITQIGGVNSSIKRVAEELVKRGHECYVLSINPGNLPNQESINGVNVIRLKSPVSKHLYWFSPSMARFLRRNLAKSLRPDIVHIHEYRSLLTPEVAYLLRSKRLPFVFSPHYDRLGYNTFAGKHLMNWYKPVGSQAFKWAEKIIVNSEYTKEILLKDFNICVEKIQIIRHGVDSLETLEGKVRKAGQTSISLLYAGVFIEKKGIHYIIQALSELKKRGRQAYLTIIGEGDYEYKLKSLAKRLDVEDSISWYESLSSEELHEKVTEADIFLLLSRDESYGIVVTEALTSGTPCIVTKTTALTEFLTEPGCFGIGYPPDPNEVADLITKIHDNEIKLGPFSKKIRTWDKVAVDYEKSYERIISQESG
ncbi:MAG: glycosyltransferase family 4 protein [Desulfobacteraceae bacterium]|nr:glycosyltransferase family 4 protein [Desulfobacteraceae bacterium]